jgi:GT2 family glycosyltransferase
MTIRELIVYDDCSSDNTAQIARSFGAHVVSGKDNVGPAVGRNRGAMQATADVVVFIDADVVVEPGAIGHLAQAIDGEDVKAAFGAYTDHSRVTHLAGRYANLRHAFTHVDAGLRGEVAETFWSGLGAIDRIAFLAVGGFDKTYARPCIEDVELGVRMRRAGWKIAIVPAARGEHLKNWTLKGLWETDIKHRALPWSKLICQGRISGTLNTRPTEMMKTVLAYLTVASAVLAAVLQGAWIAAPVLCFSAFLMLNLPFIRWLGRDSIALAVVGALLHFLYFLYAAATYAFVMARFRLRHRKPAFGLLLPAQRAVAKLWRG